MAKRSTSRSQMVGCIGPDPIGAEIATPDTLNKNHPEWSHEHNPQITVKRNRVNWS
jgi:hypothetical protein